MKLGKNGSVRDMQPWDLGFYPFLSKPLVCKKNPFLRPYGEADG
jgi:hypothetical protein